MHFETGLSTLNLMTIGKTLLGNYEFTNNQETKVNVATYQILIQEVLDWGREENVWKKSLKINSESC